MPVASCRNCGTVLIGRFCHACGQDAREPLVSIRRFLAEWADATFSWDSRLARTVAALFGDPGALARDYWAGKRASRVSPIRLYLSISFVFFLLLALMSGTLRSLVPPEELRGSDPALLVRLSKDMPIMMFLLVPWFAALLKLAFRASGRLYLEHLVVALDYNSIAFTVQVLGLLATGALVGVGAPFEALLLVSALMHGVNAVYFLRALHGAYGLGWFGTLIRAAVVAVGFTSALLLVLAFWYGLV